MATQINYKRGSIELLVLHILGSRGDCYGYEISRLIKDVSGGVLDFPIGSLYPALYRLIDDGYITDYKKKAGKRMIRVYYHIEKNGEERLTDLRQEYITTNQSIMNVLEHDFSEPDK